METWRRNVILDRASRDLNLIVDRIKSSSLLAFCSWLVASYLMIIFSLNVRVVSNIIVQVRLQLDLESYGV